MARPVCKGVFEDCSAQSASTYPVSGSCPSQDGDSRSLVLIISPVSSDRSLRPGFQTAVQLSGHLLFTTRRQARSPAQILVSALFLCRRDRRIETALLTQHRPGNACELGGQRDHDNVLVRPFRQATRPAPQWRVLDHNVRQHRASAVDQVRSQIPVAAFGYAKRSRLTSGGRLPGRQAQLGGEVTAAPETPCVADCSRQCGGVEDADTRDRRKATGRFVLARHMHKFRIEGGNSFIKAAPFGAQVLDQNPHARR